jgi:hypothetical protein
LLPDAIIVSRQFIQLAFIRFAPHITAKISASAEEMCGLPYLDDLQLSSAVGKS